MRLASESSPVVADIDGDLLPDVVMGDENGVLNGISGTGQPLPCSTISMRQGWVAAAATSNPRAITLTSGRFSTARRSIGGR